MTVNLPRTTNREMQFSGGTAIGMSHRWVGGQYCSILTAAGIVGCTPKAESYGICPGMTGRQAVELMLAAGRPAMMD